MKCGKLHGGECVMGSNACNNFKKLGHVMKDCPYIRNQEKGKVKVQQNGPL